MKVAKDKIVILNYVLKDDDGEELDSSTDDEPLVYLHGYGAVISGLEKALKGKKKGDKLSVHIDVEDAYGERDEDLVQQVSMSQFDESEEVEIDMTFEAETPDGPMMVTVTGIDGDDVTIDANHPLAGIPLNFDIEILDVRDPTPEELEEIESEDD